MRVSRNRLYRAAVYFAYFGGNTQKQRVAVYSRYLRVSRGAHVFVGGTARFGKALRSNARGVFALRSRDSGLVCARLYFERVATQTPSRRYQERTEDLR